MRCRQRYILQVIPKIQLQCPCSETKLSTQSLTQIQVLLSSSSSMVANTQTKRPLLDLTDFGPRSIPSGTQTVPTLLVPPLETYTSRG